MLRVFVLGLSMWVSAGLLSCSSDSGSKKAASGLPVPVDNPLIRSGSPFLLDWAMNPLWEDGQVELATYAAEQVVAGEVRRFSIRQTTAKQEFNHQYNVATTQRGRKDAFPVLQVNQQYSLPADGYPSPVQACLTFRRDQPVQLHKLTTSVQTEGGSTFKALVDDGLQYRQQFTSYRDGEGTGQRTLLLHALFEDALGYTLRCLDFERKPTFRASIYGLQQTDQATAPQLYQATVQVDDAPATDTLPAAWRVLVQLTPTRQNQYWFAKTYPNALLQARTWDGRRLRLQQLARVRAGALQAADSTALTPQ